MLWVVRAAQSALPALNQSQVWCARIGRHSLNNWSWYELATIAVHHARLCRRDHRAVGAGRDSVFISRSMASRRVLVLRCWPECLRYFRDEGMNVIFASYGNDSAALIQWAHEKGLEDVTVLYSDTGWAADDWIDRVERLEVWAESLGFKTVRTQSEGLAQLSLRKKSWPSNQFTFCTLELKIKPAMEWLETNDPEMSAVCLTGVRRCESEGRKDYPERIEASPNHGGRAVWSPLVDHSDEDRDALLSRSKPADSNQPIPVLPHRSRECFPCVNSGRSTLIDLAKDAERITAIEKLEVGMGHTKNGKPRTLFRPHRFAGYPTGIREVVRWAVEGQDWDNPTGDLFAECSDDGWCGM
jgi:hypothetical protein